MPKPPSSPRGKMWMWLTQLFPRSSGAHSGLITQVISRVRISVAQERHRRQGVDDVA